MLDDKTDNMLMAYVTDSYASLVKDIEEEIRRLQDLYGNRLQCRRGCDECCMAFSLLPVEGALVRVAYDNLPDEEKLVVQRQASGKNRHCPFLIQKQCCIYHSRPLICRTHGLPIAYVNAEIETIEVSACPVNFPEDAQFAQEGLLFMDPFNERLAEINYRFIQARGLPPGTRLTIQQIILNRETSKSTR